MVPKWENLEKLIKHYKYLQEKLKTDNFFLVGGCIRDLLLNINDNIEDIDLTMPGKPNEIYGQIDKNDISIFKTDKFGTITIIPKSGKKIKYELTPLREEGQYLDFRHPSEIKWSNSIIKDSIRRDFTINAIYYKFVENFEKLSDIISNPQKITPSKSKSIEEKFLQILNKEKNIIILSKIGYIAILQENETIEKIFKDAILNNNELLNFIKNANCYIFDETNFNIEQIPNNVFILLDPQKGLQDLINFEIRAVGEPDNRFQEDALRIIRGLRFVITLNEKLAEKYNEKIEDIESIEQLKSSYFDFETQTWRSMKKNYYLVQFVAKERIKEEILKIFKNTNNPFGFIALIDELNILKYIFPSVYATKHIDQPVRYHPLDTYHHTIMTLYHLQKINKNYLVRFGMLYHDVGKPDQYRYVSIGLTPEERKKVHGSRIHHPNHGADLVKKDFKNLGFSNKEIEEIAWYVKNHMKPGEWIRGKDKNIKKNLKKWLAEYGFEKVNNLIDICIADRLGQYNPLQSPEIEGLYWMKKVLKQIYEEQGKFSIKDLAINGYDIMKHFNLKPGPKIGELIKKAFDRVVEDPKNRNDKEKIIKYLEKLQTI